MTALQSSGAKPPGLRSPPRSPHHHVFADLEEPMKVRFFESSLLTKGQRAGLMVVAGVTTGLLFLTQSTGAWQPCATLREGRPRETDTMPRRLDSAGFLLLGSLVLASAMAVQPSVQQAWMCLSARLSGCGSAVRTILACAAFMLVGPALMMLNKHILQDLRFHHPMSLSVLGLLTSAVFARGMVGLGLATVRPESREVVATEAWYRSALPIGAAKAITLATGNAVYLHLGLGFIQMLKAFTPAMVVVIMLAFGVSPPSRAAIWSVCLIVLGTLVEVHGELHLTLLGLALMLISEFMEATNLVMTQRLLQNCKFTVLEGMYVLAPVGAACLLTVAAVLEWPSMIQDGSYRIVLEHPIQFVASGLLGLLVNFLSLAVVQATSSLTLKILNTVRCVGLVAVGVVFYGEDCSAVEAVGYGIALLGFTMYNWTQMYPESAGRLEHWVRCTCTGSMDKKPDMEEPALCVA